MNTIIPKPKNNIITHFINGLSSIAINPKTTKSVLIKSNMMVVVFLVLIIWFLLSFNV